MNSAARDATRGATTRTPGQLYQRVRLARLWLPPLIVAVVVAYQIFVVRLFEGSNAFWAELLFYGIAGPMVTYFVLGWIVLEVTERERAEADLRNLYQEVSESHRRLEAVSRFSKQIGSAGELETLLEVATQAMVEATHASAGAVMLEGGMLRAYKLRETPPELFQLELVREAQKPIERPTSVAGASHRLSLPLRWGERFLGAAHLYFSGMPRQESFALVEALAGDLPATIVATEQRTRDLLTLFEVDRSIRAENNLERLLVSVVSRIRERARADAVAVYLSGDDERLRLAWGQNLRGETIRNPGVEVGNLAQTVMRTHQTASFGAGELGAAHDTQTDPILHGAQAAIALPLITEAELVGVIVLGYHQAETLQPRDEPLLRLLANQVTLAVRNARAYLYSEELAILDERNRIAREIHDGIAQSLAFTALKLDLASRLLVKDPARVRAELETARETLREQIREVRRSIFALRPIDLERLGFLETVRRFVGDFGEQNNVKTELRIEGESQLSQTDEVVLFRIVQEALNNIAKHARAKHTWMTLEHHDNETTLEIRDDGRGFNPDDLTGKVSSMGGLGLHQMRERLEGRGGHFEFHSREGQGTRILVRLRA